jgi:hypothetical protein
MFLISGSEETLTDILVRLSACCDVDSTTRNIVNVDRDDILDGAFRAFNRKTFDPERLLSVRFSGEDGIDTGGLTREFMRLAMSSTRNLPIFEGDERRKLIALDYKGNLLRLKL